MFYTREQDIKNSPFDYELIIEERGNPVVIEVLDCEDVPLKKKSVNKDTKVVFVSTNYQDFIQELERNEIFIWAMNYLKNLPNLPLKR